MTSKRDSRLFQKAYKKLKSSIYYDKTNLVLRDKIVRFESKHGKNLDEDLMDLQNKFEKLNNEEWNQFIHKEILDKIDCCFFPKTLKEHEDNGIITNFNDYGVIQIDQVQSFIDLSIEGHILGVVWLLLIGYKLDAELSHCYGNQIRKTLYNDFSKRVTFSPALFEPYFVKYENWRDNALQLAENYLDKGEDILVLTLDFTRFYYSLDISEDFMRELLNPIIAAISNEEEKNLLKRINDFIFLVISHYAKEYSPYCSPESDSKRNLLPIGFLPSNVLANYALKEFDKAVINNWKPLYFGRYVDDILIVEKISSVHPHYTSIKSGKASIDDVISPYLVEEGTDDDNIKINKHPIFKKENNVYKLCKEYTKNIGKKCDIEIKNEKFKVFYFAAGNSTALLKCFRENISRNKSEFRRMPEDEVIFQKDDYSEIYELEQYEINKFRDVNGIHLDKFKFSKYLAKYKRIAGLVDETIETNFEKDIIQILNKRVIIENYTAWEKIISILYIHKKYDILNDTIEKIIKAIDDLNFSDAKKYNLPKVSESMKKNLKKFLFSGIARVYSFKFKSKSFMQIARKYGIDNLLPIKYMRTRMSDKSMYPIWSDLFIDRCNIKSSGALKIDNYRGLRDTLEFIRQLPDDWWENNQDSAAYKYYPYFINMYDLLISYQYYCMANNIDFIQNEGGYDLIKNLYVNKNFAPYEKNRKLEFPVSVKTLKEKNEQVSDKIRGQRIIEVRGEKYSEFKIAISNIKMEHKNVEKYMMGFSDRSYKRYKQISYMVNTAIEHGAHLLVMPECCVPIEWLEILSKTCAKNDLAVVTGVEHVIAEDRVYNLVAVILPFEKDEFKSAYISFHSKNYFAPAEEEMINGYRLIAMNNSELRGDEKDAGRYELYKWHDLYFSVYCCFELTSITDRAIFQSYADAIIAIEWNRDINYYSNILESLSRDLHCYCIQVNSSDFGDSRLTQPTKKERQNILRVKGGEEPVILIGTIDVAALREFQFKEFSLQQKDVRFKPTPPQLDKSIIYKKIHEENLFS